MKKQIQTTDKDVLFQKLGQTWFVFSEIENEVIYSTLPEGMDPKSIDLELYEIIEEHMSKVALHQKSKIHPEVA